MSNHERTKLVSFTAIIALAGLLIAIITNYRAFPELLFYGIVTVVIGVIVVLVVNAFLWQRCTSYIRRKMSIRKSNSLAREYFDDFREFVERFTSLGEFRNVSQGITGILQALLKKVPTKHDSLISERIKNAGSILQNPLPDFKQRLDNLQWKKKELNYELLSCLVTEFENYVRLHKRLYVDFAVTIARELSLDKISQATKRAYAEYKDDYNQFIIAYTEFAKRSSKARLGIFSKHLQKASEL